ncbi:MAG: hypothetical protein FJ213_03830 [Ignavibacteria bacterium]|nr:hypothetical protein [Ignavibacteria bacterium]
MLNKLFFVLLLTSVSFAQHIPMDFQFETKIKLNKSASGSTTQTGNSITDLITIGDTILLGSGKGLSISFDKGESWLNFYNHPKFGKEAISGLGYKNGLIWAATAHSIEKDGQTLPEGSGFLFSLDAGNSWYKVPQPIDHKDSNKVYYGLNKLNALPITTAVNNITYDVAVTKDAVWIASFAGGLRKSTNKGGTWERVVIPPDNLNSIKPTDTLSFDLSPVSGSLGYQNNLNHRVFSVYAETDSIIWVGTAGGINKSTDGGISWRKFTKQNQTNGISGNFVVAINGTKVGGATHIYAATWKAEDLTEEYAVSFTSDGGETWLQSNRTQRFHNFGFYNHISYAAGSEGLYRTDNSGVNWIKAPAIVDSITKQRIQTNTFYSAASQGNTIWIGSNSGLAKTTETGSPWGGFWRVYLAYVPVNSANETYSYPNPFNPDQEVVKIKYMTEGADKNVTIRIYDFGFNLLKTIIQNAPRSGTIDKLIQQTETWNGKDEFDSIVSNGVYFYSVEIGESKPAFGKIMVLR